MPQKCGIQRGQTNFRAICGNEPNGLGGSRRRCEREPWLWGRFCGLKAALLSRQLYRSG